MAEAHRHLRVPGLRPVPPTIHTRSVVVVTWVAGEGCCQDDPVRPITSYYDATTGEHLWTDDRIGLGEPSL